MAKLISHDKLNNTLMEFRDILSNFDFSSLKNIRFINQEAFFAYIENVDNNPFKKQFELLNQKLDILQPYLPFVHAERASEFLMAMSQCITQAESQAIKVKYTKKLRQDFIELSRTLTTSEQWEHVLNTCEEIRLHKEESAIALN
ncbi:MAG: hypothetical protein ATN34_02775 [Epulopiscium sp. Nele67-Bin002]|nr:MAG: hypothetical protein BEN18_09350 [Epulopiscium sp. Nuni2H_MBin001]OON90826.1 MAG: hypothetical protein ATN34_02775 [Epulopiscium sp. Nele67-Bin002]OON92189.1 MAG: hypothetical protein ATN33_07805 [Epulopiscium sp. Nele67-Bin001]